MQEAVRSESTCAFGRAADFRPEGSKSREVLRKGRKGIVELKGRMGVAEGNEVDVPAVAEAPATPAEGLGQLLLRHTGAAKGLPSGLARNHDAEP